jgi:hypothetical protein
MHRRKFIQKAAITASVPYGVAAFNHPAQDSNKALIEHRTYEIRFGSNQSVLLNYLKNIFGPALNRQGVNQTMIFREFGASNPVKIHMIISYPNLASYIAAQDLTGDGTYNKQSEEYHAIPADKPLYNRFSSNLMLAIDGLPQVRQPIENAGLFELRTYEGYSEDAVRRKIMMFNNEELDLFYETELNPVFFGRMIAGPHRPSLVYMLNFNDMAQRDKNWQTFIDHPEWKKMSSKPEYANSVSNIRREFLVPV